MPVFPDIKNWPLPVKEYHRQSGTATKMIQRERTVELFMEGQHYFDIRRWMICGEGEEADQSVLHSMNMNGYKDQPIGANNSFFTRIVLENRAWRRAMYLYPIPQDEIQKVGFWFKILYGKN